MINKNFEKIIGQIIERLIVLVVMSLIVMLMWNISIAELFDKSINFYQAIGLYVLSSILFNQSESKS